MNRMLNFFPSKLKTNVNQDVLSIRKLNHNILKYATPNASSERKLQQQMRHERIHQEFINGKLDRNCMIRYYLQKFSSFRSELISILKGEINNNYFNKLSTRLGNIPLGTVVLAGRGFAFDFIKYPNCNKMLTPHFLLGRTQFSKYENQTDKITCKLRYTCETNYSRITDTKSLQGIITYDKFPYLQHCHNWAHARCNLQKPLRNPIDFDD